LLACLCAAGVATAAVWMAAPILITLIYGSHFAAAILLLRVEVLILPATAITSFATTAVLTVRQDTAGVLIGAIIGTCIGATALGIAFTTHSVWTLIYGTVAAEFTVALWYIVRMRYLAICERGAQQADAVTTDVLVRKDHG